MGEKKGGWKEGRRVVVGDMKGGLPQIVLPLRCRLLLVFQPGHGRVSAHETSFTLSPLHSLSLLVFLDLCSQYFSTDRKWESHLLQQHSRLAQPVAAATAAAVRSAILRCCSCHVHQRRGEERRETTTEGGRETEEYGRVQLNGKKDEDETRGTSTGMMFRFWREGGGNSADEQRTKRLSSRAG